MAGDCHGNPRHLEYLFTEAQAAGAHAIFQVGDYGFWEHVDAGGAFLDLNAAYVKLTGIPLYWIDGNHESHTLLRERYGPGGSRYEPTPEGFWTIRPGVYYVPRGTRWTWQGRELMGLGGAYSVDKDWRLDIERYGGLQRNGRHGPPTGPRTQWWPEEELTDEEIDLALAQSSKPLDILFCHDKPRASNPGWNRKDLPGCYPNQDKIQEVVRTLRPKLVVHGHLHVRYTDQVRASGDSWTTVMGLDCDGESEYYDALQSDEEELVNAGRDILSRSWVLLDLAQVSP